MKSYFIVCLKYLFAWLSFNKCRQKYFQIDYGRVCCRTAKNVESSSCGVSFIFAFGIVIDCCSFFYLRNRDVYANNCSNVCSFFRDSIKSDSSESWKRLEWLLRHDRVDRGLPGQELTLTPLTGACRYREWLVFIVLVAVSFVRSFKKAKRLTVDFIHT